MAKPWSERPVGAPNEGGRQQVAQGEDALIRARSECPVEADPASELARAGGAGPATATISAATRRLTAPRCL